MSRLSACYFCGTALDDPVQDYPVLPEALRGDGVDPTTVTLCDACHEKLAGIVSKISDAVDASPGSSAGAASSSPTSVETPQDPDDVLVEPDADDAATAGGQPSTADATDRQSSGDDGDVNAVPDPRGSDQGDAADGPDGDPAAAAQAGIEGNRESGDESADDEPTGVAGSHENDQTDAGDQTDQSDDGDQGDDGERSVVEGRHDVSALEYNKVMRLLQNREFPVDREEIEVVAANAYQVARSDCANVIDVAVDRGLIEEVDGQLRKPDNA